MSKDEREKRWMAYMDGQMSTSEALEFERSLTSLDKERADGEVRLESAVCESLVGRECCPVALWASIQERMTHTCQAPKRCWKSYLLTRGATVMAAMGLMIFAVLFLPGGGGSGNPVVADIVNIDHTTVDEFARDVEVPAVFSEAQRFLNENRINMELINPVSLYEGRAHDIQFLGACTGKCKEKSIIELRFSCCGKPAALLVAREGTAGAHRIRDAFKQGKIQDMREDGGYVTGVACGHDSKGLLEMLRPRTANLI